MRTRTRLVAIAVPLAAVALAFVSAPEMADAKILPDGERAPIVWSAEIKAPQAHNRLLEVDLTVDATDDGGLAGYEYRWNRGTIGSVQTTSLVRPVVSYETLQPETRYVLEVRAVDNHGWRSKWVLAADTVTPPPPALIVAGDSVASGYHRQWFTSKGSCLDRDYSFGSTVQQMLADSLPSQWAPTYRNVAWAGAGFNSMNNGGTDSCGSSHASQVDAVVNAANPSTWNIVVATGGINSTNWSNVVAELTKNTAFSLTESGDRAACASAVTNQWNLNSRTSSVASGARSFADSIIDRTNANIYWTSYYSIIGARLAPGWTPIGSECSEEMAEAMDLLHSTLRSGLGDRVTWIDVDQDDLAIQDWGGWPHPSASGHKALGETVGQQVLAVSR